MSDADLRPEPATEWSLRDRAAWRCFLQMLGEPSDVARIELAASQCYYAADAFLRQHEREQPGQPADPA